MLDLKYRNYLASYKHIICDGFQTNPKGLNTFVVGLDLYNQDKSYKAIKIFEKVLKLCKTPSDFCATYAFLGICYEEVLYPELAKEAYLSSISYNDKISTVWSNLGLLYKADGKYADAIDCFHKAIDCDPNNAYPHYNLGALYFRTADNDQALSCCYRALQLQPNLHQAAEVICCIHYLENRPDMFRRYYQMAVSNGGNKTRMDNILEEYKRIEEFE